MKQEYWIVLVIGLLIAAYVLEAIVQPLGLDLATPYHYIVSTNLTTYPLTTTLIVVRAIALIISPIWVMTFIEKRYGLKAGVSLVLAGVSQLYVLQELATGSQILPLEWSLSIALAGLALLPMLLFYFLKAGASAAHSKLTGGDNTDSEEEENEEEEEEEEKE